MIRFRQKRLTFEMAVRMVADTVMVNTALLTALALRYMWAVGVEGGVVLAQAVFRQSVIAYLNSFWLLTPLSLTIFYLSGFYTHGRAYRGRYKALVIAQAVSLSILIYGFLSFLFPDAISLPRSVVFLTWFLTLALLIGARLWSKLWITLQNAERRLRASPAIHHDRAGNVLVIGGAGYIGSALLPKLLREGYRVRLLDSLIYGIEPIQNTLHHPRLELMHADFRQIDKVVGAMRDIDAVVHLGAIVGDPACALDEALTTEVNSMATRMIAEVAKGSGVGRFIFASTCSVYGASDQLLDEFSALEPLSLYARSKIASEKVLRQLTDANFAPTILRFATIYGLSERPRFDLVVNLLTAKALVEGQITIQGGEQWRPFLHVDDAALAVLKALKAPPSAVNNQIFNVGSDEQNLTIQQVGEIIHRIVPTAELISRGMDTDKRNYRVNFSKIRGSLDFIPQRTIEQGVHQIVEAIQSGQIKDYKDAKYNNARFLSEGGAYLLAPRQSGWNYDLVNQTSPQSLVAASG